MKSREIKELKLKPKVELEKVLAEDRVKLRHLKLDLVAGKVKNVGELRALRKTIARVQTFLKNA